MCATGSIPWRGFHSTRIALPSLSAAGSVKFFSASAGIYFPKSLTAPSHRCTPCLSAGDGMSTTAFPATECGHISPSNITPPKKGISVSPISHFSVLDVITALRAASRTPSSLSSCCYAVLWSPISKYRLHEHVLPPTRQISDSGVFGILSRQTQFRMAVSRSNIEQNKS